MLEKEEEVAELRRRLGELIRLVETYQETLPEPVEEALEPADEHHQVRGRLARPWPQMLKFGCIWSTLSTTP